MVNRFNMNQNQGALVKKDQVIVDTDIEQISETEIISYLKLSRQLPGVLSDITKQKIIVRTARDANITLKELEIQQTANRFRRQHNLTDARDTIEWLEKNQLDTAEFEELICNILLIQKLAQHLFEDKVEAYFYNNHLNYYKTIFYEIIVGDRYLAMELFYSLQEQETSFWNLAHQYNQDDELRRNGGYRGIQTRDRLHPEIAAAIFAAQNLPTLLKPITIDKSAHLIYVEEIVTPELNSALRLEIIEQLFKQWLQQQVR